MFASALLVNRVLKTGKTGGNFELTRDSFQKIDEERL